MKTLITVLLLALATAPFHPNAANPPVQTRDSWRSVRTNNLFVIGNADPEKLRQVAAWLEFFHSAFARLVSRNVIDQSVPTTVVLFRDEASFTPFKPLYQGQPANVAGFFQPGEDVNYIAISLDPGERDPFSTAFHEYVHLHLKDNVPGVPLWLNEGLAEFYGTMQFSGGEAVLGAPLAHYIRLLREQEMLPLSTLFSIGTNSPHYNEQAKSGVFYGQSWALVHYLMLGGGNSGTNGRQDQFKRFLQQVSRGDTPAKALEDSFGMTVTAIESELRAYVRRGEFPALRIASADPEAYASFTAMQRSSLSDAEANYYLGDLLFHINRHSDAERYLKHAIALDPSLRQAHAALGLLYVYQRRYADAKRYLQRATEAQQSYLIHYLYAFVLSREGVSANGLISNYSKESAAIMRENLLQSIKLAPQYDPAYYLLALVDFVTNERLDEAVAMVQRARQLAPAKTSYSLLLAQIYLRRSQNAEARELLESLARGSDAEVRNDAKEILDSLNGQPNRTTAPRVSSAMITEPAAKGSSTRIVGGGGSDSVEIRDGHKITNSASLPAVDDVLERHVEAMGGKAAINRVTSRVIAGTVDVAGISRGGSFETHALAPDKILTVIQAHPMGTIKIGFNGKNGWYLTSGAVRALKGAELATLQREADFYSPLRIRNNFAKVTLPGMSKIGYRDVYVLDLQPLSGAAERLYLDAQTYLPVRINTVRTVGRVSEPVEIYFDDWRDFEGIKYPFSTSQNSPSVKLGFTVKEIRHNVAVDAKLFEPVR